jgi:hypothetical protein
MLFLAALLRSVAARLAGGGDIQLRHRQQTERRPAGLLQDQQHQPFITWRE